MHSDFKTVNKTADSKYSMLLKVSVVWSGTDIPRILLCTILACSGGTSGNELASSGTNARVSLASLHHLWIYLQCILACPLWSSNSPSAMGPFQRVSECDQQVVWSLLCCTVPLVRTRDHAITSSFVMWSQPWNTHLHNSICCTIVAFILLTFYVDGRGVWWTV